MLIVLAAGTSAHPLSATNELFQDSDLVVNTTSLGMNNENIDALPDLANLPDHALDNRYCLQTTRHASAAKSAGQRVEKPSMAWECCCIRLFPALKNGLVSDLK